MALAAKDDLFDPAEAGAEAASVEAAIAEADFDPDEDLFHFDEIPSVDPAELASIAAEAGVIEDPDATVAPSLGDSFADTFAPPAATPPATEAPAPAAAAPAPPAEAARAEALPAGLEAARRSPSPRATWIALAAILAGNVGLLAFAWTASHSLRSALDDVKERIETAGATAPAAHTTRSAQPASPALATSADVSVEELALAVAEREIADGRSAAARERLYRLLAIADSIDPTVRADVEARACFLVADAYAAEARARAEAGP